MGERTKEALRVHFDTRVRLAMVQPSPRMLDCWHVASWTTLWD
jgi:hypothetical protein